MHANVKVAFASGTDELNQKLIERMEALFPELPLYVVSEFQPARGKWIRYHPLQTMSENMARCRHALQGKSIRLAGVLVVPNLPYRRLRLMALILAPINFVAFNEHLDSFMFRPRCLPAIARHAAWRTGNFIRWHCNPGGGLYTFLWRLRRPAEWRAPILRSGALVAGVVARWKKRLMTPQSIRLRPGKRPPGVSVVIPSRDGLHLLLEMLPPLCAQMEGESGEIIVVDNGSSDGTAGALQRAYPNVRVVVSAEPLSFARAVNRGIAQAAHSHVCLLNNDMIVRPGFVRELRAAFVRNPDLFCATAQIFFPEGKRREETGKAVWARDHDVDFPVRCDLPVESENDSYVLYGSGGCSLYDAQKLEALGNVGEVFEPAYVEDLDLGYRAWLQGWPTVFVRDAQVEHRHRATTSRFYSQEQLDLVLEMNHLRFLCRATSDPEWFGQQWREAIDRLWKLAYRGYTASAPALRFALKAPAITERPEAILDEKHFTAAGSGDVAVFPGSGGGRPVVMIASLFQPYPLAHGGAVRIYNLMKRCAVEFDLVLLCFASTLETPPPELLSICAEVIVVRRQGSHWRKSSPRPDEVEEFDSNAFRTALRLSIAKWRPIAVQFELTPMAVFLPDCKPVPSILVEHDITFDLYEQLVRTGSDWDHRQQLAKWIAFETAAWRQADYVITMSEQDARRVKGTQAVAIANGVDLERYRPLDVEPEPGRLLFIGSFGHLPNLLALEFFLRDVWPRIQHLQPVLHVIAGRDPQRFLEHHSDRVQVDLRQPGIELQGFVSDVRPAYGRASVVIAPLVCSAGTNIKIMEAMAMGKAIVSTPAGVNGIDVTSGQDVIVTNSAEEMAEAIALVLRDAKHRKALENSARSRAVRDYNWDDIAGRQLDLYRAIAAGRSEAGPERAGTHGSGIDSRPLAR